MGRIPRLGFVALIVILNIATGGHYSYPVTGVIGGNTELAIQQNFSDVKEIVWKFIRGSRTFKIAEFKDNKLETGDPQFQNRLEIFRDGMGLRIKNVILNDSGTYIARITLENHTLYEESFNVSLYEPVPVPSIKLDDENGTGNSKEGSGDTVTGTLQNRHHYYLLFVVLLFVVLVVSSVASIIHYNKEKMKSRAPSQTSCKEEAVKFSVPEKGYPIALSEIRVDTNPIQEDVPFSVSENAIKYSEHFFPVHVLKQDDKMAFDDGELPSTLPLQEDSEKT